MTRKIVLKIDVDTFRGTLQGVPALVELFAEYDIKATFLFSVGPDHTGWALKRVFRPGFFSKVQRTSVVSHYGIKTLLYGVLLPGPHIGRRASHVIRQTLAAGHESGIHSYDHVYWQDNVASADADWTVRQLDKSMRAYVEAAGCAPTTLGAAGWQINPRAIAWEAEQGFHYASDCRGGKPFFPKMGSVVSQCMQIPTTLPTLDEVLGVGDIDESNVHEAVLGQMDADRDCEIYTLHAELEGMKLLPVMRRLIESWLQMGCSFQTLQQYYQSLDVANVPTKTLEWQSIAGRSGVLAVEGAEIDTHTNSSLKQAI